MKGAKKKAEKFREAHYAIVFSFAALALIVVYFLSAGQMNIRISAENLITKNIGEWNFREISQGTKNGIPFYTAYYNKALPGLRSEESKVDIYAFANSAAARNEINRMSYFKGCGYVKEKDSNVIIFECFQSGIWWASNNLLINIGGSPRTFGMYIDAYDLVVCPLDGCESEYVAYAPKAIFDAYMERYPAD